MDDTVEVFGNVRVPEAQNAEALVFQPVGAGLVSGRVVLAAVDFDDQALAEFDEIDDVKSDRGLATEMQRCGAVEIT